MSIESDLHRQRAAADRLAAEATPLANQKARLLASSAAYDRLAAQQEGLEAKRAARQSSPGT